LKNWGVKQKKKKIRWTGHIKIKVHRSRRIIHQGVRATERNRKITEGKDRKIHRTERKKVTQKLRSQTKTMNHAHSVRAADAIKPDGFIWHSLSTIAELDARSEGDWQSVSSNADTCLHEARREPADVGTQSAARIRV
jgi:hypothetical protein